MTRSPRYTASAAGLLALGPLLLSAAPHSPLAHDEGYYMLQARWIGLSGHWLAPQWWGQPLYDRTIGAPWLIAASQQMLGSSDWAAHPPSLLAAGASLWITAQLGRQLLGPDQGWLSALLLALTPLWLNYAHQASQDMPLLALELLGLWALLRATPGCGAAWPLLAGLWMGPAFLIKGFMVALPAAALAPLLLLKRRPLLRDGRFWAGLALGWLPVALWLGLSLRHYGPSVVGGLVEKLLFLSGSDTYSAGPLYYLWNLPANAAPWSLAALAGLAWGWRRWRDEQRLVLVVTPLLLLALLSAFRTKTPYYGLQLTPFLALWGAAALRWWAEGRTARIRWLAWGLGALGGLLLAAGLALLLPGTPLQLAVPPLPSWVLAAAALAVGFSWGLLPLQRSPRVLLAALLLGPWLALVLLVQAGLFTDRSPLQRLALQAPSLQAALGEGPVAVVAPEPLSGEAHSQLILVALGSPTLGPRLNELEQLPPGQWAWIQRQQLPAAPSAPLSTVAAGDDLAPWTLVRRNPAPAP